ncbi:MAG: type II secretion system F family protein [Anaerolineales bacterium]|nr:type II secretion system F family protein [Anaerolineales bacterium]
MILNTLAALTAAAGLYIFFLGLYSYIAVSISGRKGNLLSDAGQGILMGRGAPGPVERLEQLLYRARLDVSAQEFLAVAAVCGLLAGGFMFFATGSLLASGAGFLSGLLLYWMVLLHRQEKNLEAYETAMPNALRDLRSAFRLRGLSLVKALEMVAEFGPEGVRPDFQELAAAFSGARFDLSRLQNLMGLRGSYTLDRVAEALLQFHTTPQRIPEIIDLLIPRLRKEVAIRREMRANISGPRRELLVVVLMPFAIVFFFRFAAPDYAAFYSSFFGQMLILAAWVMDVLLFVLATTVVKRIVNPMPYDRAVPERRRVLPAVSTAASVRAAGAVGEQRMREAKEKTE